LRIVIATNGGAIEGVVGGREAAAGATVVLIPAPARRFVPEHYRVMHASETGTFSRQGIPPGVYQLFAWESVPDTAWLNPDFMGPWEGRGQVVTVRAGTTLHVRPRLLAND
jgi:hypothetical protein